MPSNLKVCPAIVPVGRVPVAAGCQLANPEASEVKTYPSWAPLGSLNPPTWAVPVTVRLPEILVAPAMLRVLPLWERIEFPKPEELVQIGK